MRTKTAQKIFELMDVMKESRIKALDLEMPGFKFHALKNALPESPRQAEVSFDAPIPRVEVQPIVAPRLGFFSRAEKPNGHFLAGPGQKVGEKDVVGFIQVLEKAYPVPAGVRGTIVQVCAEDGKMVEFKQPLFLVAESREKA